MEHDVQVDGGRDNRQKMRHALESFCTSQRYAPRYQKHFSMFGLLLGRGVDCGLIDF